MEEEGADEDGGEICAAQIDEQDGFSLGFF
jgi:hypothetical protein